MAAEGMEQERAQLWAVYFGMRALTEPPSFLKWVEQALWEYLAETKPSEEAQVPPEPQRKPKRRRRSHLSVIGGGG